jgi:cyclic pyranopterin monophosphate synthase
VNRLTHVADDGSARMVDVSAKERSAREAIAAGRIELRPETLDLITKNQIGKGNVFATARIAGIQAAKQTSQLIPLCHNLNLSHVDIQVAPSGTGLEVKCVARTVAQTGVEMEALTGVGIALLTIYDMCKAVDKEMRITDIRLLKKTKRDSGGME